MPCAGGSRFRRANKRKTFRDNSAQKVFNVCLAVFSHMHTQTHTHMHIVIAALLLTSTFSEVEVLGRRRSLHSIHALSVLEVVWIVQCSAVGGAERRYHCFRFLTPLLSALLSAYTSHLSISRFISCFLYQHK